MGRPKKAFKAVVQNDAAYAQQEAPALVKSGAGLPCSDLVCKYKQTAIRVGEELVPMLHGQTVEDIAEGRNWSQSVFDDTKRRLLSAGYLVRRDELQSE